MSTQKQKCAVWLAAPLAAVLLFAFTQPHANAQATDGNLTGAILDVTGAAVPNAGIELENTATGIRIAGRSDASGVYRVLNVPAGSYNRIRDIPRRQRSR
jgi:hypothetical protein